MEAIAVAAADRPASPVALLPAGACLVHIGPHKTGTTSVQSAFHLARRVLAAHGVHYAGPDRHPVIAVQAAVESRVDSGRRANSGERWRALVAEIARHPAERVVLSSEWFSEADDAAIRRVVGDLDPARVHVAVTVRSLARLLPSQWQQHVAAGLTLAYEPWLDAVFGRPDSAPATTFWGRHRHDRLVARWAEVVGMERVSVVVVDEVDRGAVLRGFERLVGLPNGALVPEPDRANRSFTAPEAELMLAVNTALVAESVDSNLRLNLGLYGAAATLRLREPGVGEPRIETPAWALERAAETAAEIVAGIERSGVGVLGDLGTLVKPSPAAPSRAATAGESSVDWPDLIASAGVGALTATGLARGRRSGDSPATILAPLSTERLRRVVSQRATNALRVRRRAIRRRRESTPDLAAPPERDLTSAESAAVASFRDAVAAEGLARNVYDRVEREGVTPELLRQDRRATQSDAASWSAVGAALVVGVIRYSGLLLAGAPGHRVPPARARIETLEVARVPSVDIAIVILNRLIAAVPRRVAAAISRQQPAPASPERGAL
ncbi:MAG TPA: hypothetical protein VMQ65_01880 [Candidatus Limnocylindria bacterium]|nr:hypothetical protein [Candidatus Limnocylindria bacterium]